MKVAIVNTQVPFIRGGAEVLADGLTGALKRAGHEVEVVNIPFRWYPSSALIDHALACRLLDLSESNGEFIDTVITLKFPSYLVNHPNKRLWLLHQHRSAYDFWGKAESDLNRDPLGLMTQEFIRSSDALAFKTHKKLYSISKNVSLRLKESIGLDAGVLYPPVDDSSDFSCQSADDYLLFPSRVNETKRQHLVLEALRHCKSNAKVIFAGPVEKQDSISRQLQLLDRDGLRDRAEFTGSVSRSRLIDLYSRCAAVLFVPLDEDYGYITPEAMYSSKAVITTSDSGGALEFVEHNVTGLVVPPTAEAIADAIDLLWLDRQAAKVMGVGGRERVAEMGLSWDAVLEGLLG